MKPVTFPLTIFRVGLKHVAAASCGCYTSPIVTGEMLGRMREHPEAVQHKTGFGYTSPTVTAEDWVGYDSALRLCNVRLLPCFRQQEGWVQHRLPLILFQSRRLDPPEGRHRSTSDG